MPEAENAEDQILTSAPEPAPEDADDDVLESADEGDIAADYLEELLDIGDFDGDIDIEVRGGRTYLSIAAEDNAALAPLVGEDGEVLDALQELTRLAVLAETGERSRLILDIAGRRAQQGSRVKASAAKAIERARETGEDVALEPMTPYERKQVHDLVAEAGLTSESAGEGSKRHVIILGSEA